MYDSSGEAMSGGATTNAQTEWRDAIRREAERVHESAKLSSETQFEYAKRWRTADRWIGGLASALAAVAGVSALADYLSITVVGVIAIASALAGSIAASLGAPKTKEKASISANAFRALQQDARIFLTIDLPSLSQTEARERLQSLVGRHQELNAEADIPSLKSWERAKQTLEAGSQDYEVDK